MIKMAKLLYISANPKGPEKSKGMQIGEAFLQSFIEEQPDINITKIDLFQFDMARMDADLISARGKLAGYGLSFDDLTEQEKTKISKMHRLADEFIQYDYFVFVSPLWNLSSPAVLKTFLDNLFVTGKTFVHTANGPKGLLSGKTAIHIQTRGGLYTGLPMAELESGDRYLKIALRFLGIDVLDSVIAEGLDAFPKKAPGIVGEAKVRAVAAAKVMARQPAYL
ncbi:NAD(P)H-dependent oxidoreductase [Bacillus sp. FJAT-27245]|uniref:NAD(P)H-dependent oxidoreductase n=1 Tax=Bacillus sp. FJAT-27245 TaxID=1684144 RepID=UPI000B30547B|nr:NAD(P)H-dependent oxidoreductase [Bacillus sp. FJAT-27245]